jgi:hypothetical protein
MRRAGVGSCAECTIEVCGKFHWRPAPGSRNVHTLPFAFRPPQGDDESVKISNTTAGRSSTLTPVLPAGRRRSSALCASDHAQSIVILLALSGFSEGPAPSDVAKGCRCLCFKPGEACLPQAGLSPSFSVPSAFLCVLCVKSFAFLCALCRPKPQFLFNTNEPLPNFTTHTKQTTSFFLFDATECLSRTSNFATHTKQITSSQITSLFLFDTNERSPITTHQSLITDFLTR